MENNLKEKIFEGELDTSSLSVKKIKEIVDECEFEDLKILLEVLSKDGRKSVVSLANSIEKKIKKHREEIERLKKMNVYENKYYKEGYKIIAGIDEAGRGPLAGPVVAAVAILPRDSIIEGINDSKKLSKVKREELFDIIKREAVDYGIGIADNFEIDDVNILNATYLAMKRAIESLKLKPDCTLNDAVVIPNIDKNIHQVSIIKGDAKSISIAAASILAKVTRDRMMEEYDKKYPGYGFSKNMGYGTNEHYEGLKKYGKTEIHRESFLKNFEC